MNDKQNKPQADRPRWITTRPARPVKASADYLHGLPLGAVLTVPVRLGDVDSPVTLSVVKVSAAKFGVHQRRGFPARLLVGARVVRRVRLDATAAPGGSEVTA